ncbi:MAG: hypothetical protein ACE5JR_09865 [Gemmatimonadota bacterium]
MTPRVAHFALAVRWAARFLGLGPLAVIALHVVSGGTLGPLQANALGPIGTFFLLTACFGLLLGWRWEGPGGLIAVGSLAAFYVAGMATTGVLPRGWTFSTVGIAGFLFILARVLTIVITQERGAPGSGTRRK